MITNISANSCYTPKKISFGANYKRPPLNMNNGTPQTGLDIWGGQKLPVHRESSTSQMFISSNVALSQLCPQSLNTIIKQRTAKLEKEIAENLKKDFAEEMIESIMEDMIEDMPEEIARECAKVLVDVMFEDEMLQKMIEEKAQKMAKEMVDDVLDEIYEVESNLVTKCILNEIMGEVLEEENDDVANKRVEQITEQPVNKVQNKSTEKITEPETSQVPNKRAEQVAEKRTQSIKKRDKKQIKTSKAPQFQKPVIKSKSQKIFDSAVGELKKTVKTDRQELYKVCCSLSGDIKEPKTIINATEDIYERKGKDSQACFSTELMDLNREFNLDLSKQNIELLMKYILEKKALEMVESNEKEINKTFFTATEPKKESLLVIGYIYLAIQELSNKEFKGEVTPEKLKNFKDEKFALVDNDTILNAAKYGLNKYELSEILSAKTKKDADVLLEQKIKQKIVISNLVDIPDSYHYEKKAILSHILAKNKIEYNQLSNKEKELLNVLLELDSKKNINKDAQKRFTEKAVKIMTQLQKIKAFDDKKYQERIDTFGKTASMLVKNDKCTPLAITTLLAPSKNVVHISDVNQVPFSVDDEKNSSYLNAFREYREDLSRQNLDRKIYDKKMQVIAGSYADMMSHLKFKYGDSDYPNENTTGVYHNPKTKEVKHVYLPSSFNNSDMKIAYIDEKNNIKELYLGQIEELDPNNELRTREFISQRSEYVWNHYATRGIANYKEFDTERGSGVEILSGIKELEEYDGLVEIKSKGCGCERLFGRVYNDNTMEILFYGPNGIHKDKPFELYPLVDSYELLS